MSRCRYVSQDERQRKATLARAIKEITGNNLKTPVCVICHKGFTDQELLTKDLVYTVTKTGSTQIHNACFKAEFFGG